MKKIPTLFVREFKDHTVVKVTPEITLGMEDAFLNATPTIKIDGSCCMIAGGELYKRYDAKKGKVPPAGAIPCCDPDPVTGHWPHWVKVGSGPEDMWFRKALENSSGNVLPDGTYEAIGPHFKTNPYGLENDILVKHGIWDVSVPRTFEGIREYLERTPVEGLVFWMDGKPCCKIKRSDFGFKWPCEGADEFFRSLQKQNAFTK